jgi:hypothetical protein
MPSSKTSTASSSTLITATSDVLNCVGCLKAPALLVMSAARPETTTVSVRRLGVPCPTC